MRGVAGRWQGAGMRITGSEERPARKLSYVWVLSFRVEWIFSSRLLDVDVGRRRWGGGHLSSFYPARENVYSYSAFS